MKFTEAQTNALVEKAYGYPSQMTIDIRINEKDNPDLFQIAREDKDGFKDAMTDFAKEFTEKVDFSSTFDDSGISYYSNSLEMSDEGDEILVWFYID